MKKGLFITFEGIDGCGKSTQAKTLHNYIFSLSKYNHCVLTREPYQDEEIRKKLKLHEDPYTQARELAEMFVADRRRHLLELVIPNLRQGLHVISDRYSLSTLAYQQTQGMLLSELLKMHEGLSIPDLTFIVDVPVDVAIKRMKKDRGRKEEQKFEKNIEFIEKLRANYLGLTRVKHHNIAVIDGRKKPQEVFEKQIKPAFDNLYNSPFSN